MCGGVGVGVGGLAAYLSGTVEQSGSLPLFVTAWTESRGATSLAL